MNTPNKLTVSRFFLVILFVVVFFIDSLIAKIFALVIVILIEFTDYLDGKIARSQKLVTKFGKLVDPLADSISRLTIYISYAAYNISSGSFIAPVWSVGNIHLIPVWMVILLLIRELTVSTLRTLAASHNIIIHARTSGKIKAVMQATGIISILLLVIYNNINPNFVINIYSYYIMLVVVIITLLSGLEYILSNKELLKQIDI